MNDNSTTTGPWTWDEPNKMMIAGSLTLEEKKLCDVLVTAVARNKNGLRTRLLIALGLKP